MGSTVLSATWVLNDAGEWLAFKRMAGHVDDRAPVPALTRGLFGKRFGDKGYLSQPLFDPLDERGGPLITRLHKNRKNKLMPLADKRLAHASVPSSSVSTPRSRTAREHRAYLPPPCRQLSGEPGCGLVAYTYQPKKPPLNSRAPTHFLSSQFLAPSSRLGLGLCRTHVRTGWPRRRPPRGRKEWSCARRETWNGSSSLPLVDDLCKHL